METTDRTDRQVSTIPRLGRFAGRQVSTNRQGRGVFTRESDGSLRQHTGTMQTPWFKSSRHLAAWLRRHYDY